VEFDEPFLARLKKGEHAAFEELVESFEGAVYRFFYCDHRDHHLAHEQSAETFVQLVSAFRTMRGGPEKLRAFVMSVARNVQRRSWRQRKAGHEPLPASVAAPDRSPDDEAIQSEQTNYILQVIAGLESPVGQILVMRFVDEYSLAEIAEALDLPLGTVKSHIHRGRNELKLLLERKEISE